MVERMVKEGVGLMALPVVMLDSVPYYIYLVFCFITRAYSVVARKTLFFNQQQLF